MTAQIQTIPPERVVARAKAPIVVFALLAAVLLVGVLAGRIPADVSTSGQVIGVPSAGGLVAPGLQVYVPHTSSTQVTRPQPRLTGPLHPPRNHTRGVDPVVSSHSRAV
jgi:hypothetical protein